MPWPFDPFICFEAVGLFPYPELQKLFEMLMPYASLVFQQSVHGTCYERTITGIKEEQILTLESASSFSVEFLL